MVAFFSGRYVSPMSRWPPRPTLSGDFYKAHGLGNDYLVFEEGDAWVATPGNVARVCDRFRGAGSDGIVVLLRESTRAFASLRMFNPDGGEFERSGNGLRVLGSFLARREPGLRVVRVRVGGDEVVMHLHGSAGATHDIAVEMGRAEVGPAAVELDPAALVGHETGADAPPAGRAVVLPGPDGDPLHVVPVGVGNPHMVVLVPDRALNEARLAEIGPFVTAHPALRHGANVQLAGAAGDGRCRALIWERGVGRTSASGTSSCAVAVAMVVTGRLPAGTVQVDMPGGALFVEVTDALDVTLRGPVEEVMEGRLTAALVATFEPGR
jgi:diaminopimelate epimerase